MTLLYVMTDNNLHEYFQSSYKPGHSTETALVKVQNDILTSIEQHVIVMLILLDTIYYNVLFSRMESTLGITGPALEWFRSYLGDRTLRVQIDDSFSASQEMLWAVPQGSVLGLLLFLIYILPLGILIRKHGLELHAYTDDTQLYISIKPINRRVVDIGIAKLENFLVLPFMV